MPEHLQIEFGPDEAGRRLDAALATRLGDLSRARVRRLVEAGDVRLNGKPAKPSLAVHDGDMADVTIPDPEPAQPPAQEMPLRVMHEDEDLLVIDKPAGLVVHPGAGTRDGTLVNALLARPGSLSAIGGVLRPGIVHRLDKDTSGLMLVAKNDLSHRRLSEALASREITRVYWALALRAFRETAGAVEAPIGRHPTVRTKMGVVEHGGRAALTRWRVRENFGPFSLVECRLATGRTHQIRVHLSHIGHPVLGDDLYGGGAALAMQLCPPRDQALRTSLSAATRQMLHARELAFAHPRSGEAMHFLSEPPADMAAILAALRAGVWR